MRLIRVLNDLEPNLYFREWSTSPGFDCAFLKTGANGSMAKDAKFPVTKDTNPEFWGHKNVCLFKAERVAITTTQAAQREVKTSRSSKRRKTVADEAKAQVANEDGGW
jgi:hypothetical protein